MHGRADMQSRSQAELVIHTLYLAIRVMDLAWKEHWIREGFMSGVNEYDLR